jgi:hypothetical protein
VIPIRSAISPSSCDGSEGKHITRLEVFPVTLTNGVGGTLHLLVSAASSFHPPYVPAGGNTNCGVELRKIRTKRVPRNGAHEEPHMDMGNECTTRLRIVEVKSEIRGDSHPVAINFL